MQNFRKFRAGSVGDSAAGIAKILSTRTRPPPARPYFAERHKPSRIVRPFPVRFFMPQFAVVIAFMALASHAADPVLATTRGAWPPDWLAPAIDAIETHFALTDERRTGDALTRI